jgi:transcriptional regulator with XRE-family HTH domain
MPHLDAAIQRLRLGRRLVALRNAAGKSQEDIMAELGWSRSTVNRIENGVAGVTPGNLKDLLRVYEVHEESTVADLEEIARATRRHSEWARYSSIISAEFARFLAHEEAALSIRSYQPLVMPGLLQTDEYAAAMVGAAGRRDRTHVKRVVELRQRRQDKLDEALADPCSRRYSFVVFEPVISLCVGSPDVMRRQLEHLIRLAQQPHLSIRVVPFSRGAFTHWRQPHVLLEVTDSPGGDVDDIVLFLENPGKDKLVTERTASDRSVAGQPTPVPSEWLRDYVALESSAGTREDTLAALEASIRKFAGP